MPRKLRTWIPNSFYHITCRGNRRGVLFKDDGDFYAFYHILQEVHKKTPFELATYCLMTNHFHLQLRSTQHSISKIMLLINKRYATYYNTKNNFTGHVFEQRYFSEPINDRSGMLGISRYIHLNPVEAEMVLMAEDYPWSSYSYYKNSQERTPAYMNIDIVLDLFLGFQGSRRMSYCNFVHQYVPGKTLRQMPQE